MSAHSPLGYVLGYDVLVVGVEDDPTEKYEDGSPCVRVYIDARWQGRYVIPTQDHAHRIRDAWKDTTAHLVVPRPDPDCIMVDAKVVER